MEQRAENSFLPAEAPTLARPYDFAVIRDFFHHLLWDLRHDHSSWVAPAAGSAGPAPDRSALSSGGQPGEFLLPPIKFKRAEDLSADERQRVRARMAALRQAQIRALEVLPEGPISDVLRCAGVPTGSGASPPPAVELDSANLLEKEGAREIEGT